MTQSKKNNASAAATIPIVAPAKMKLTKEYVLILLLSFLCYGLSVLNDYALDDYIVLVKNQFVQRGFSGISSLLSKDTFAGMTDANVMVVPGGRYRPLSLVTFAIENQLFDNSPGFTHFINVLLAGLTGIFLYKVLCKFFPANQLIPLATALLFVALPIHSEAVINIKGRDDLMCFLFFLMSLNYLFAYLNSAKNSQLLWSFLCYSFSLLSKETALTFVAIIPLCLYFFSTKKTMELLRLSGLFLVPALLFLLLRYSATHANPQVPNNDIFNNPFVFMTSGERIATLLLTWLLYLKLIFFPIHLSYDYNYNEIPTAHFSDPAVWISVLLFSSLILLAFLGFKRKSIASFCILFFLITFSIFSNVFFNIGTLLAERFVYVSSFGICLLLVSFLAKVDSHSGKDSTGSSRLFWGFLTVILLLCIYRNALRCGDWKDGNTLFIADVKSTPNNAKANLNAGLAYLNLAEKEDSLRKFALLDSAAIYLKRGVAIYPKRPEGYLNMGVLYSWKNMHDSSEVWWNKARAIEPNNPTLQNFDKVLSQHYFTRGLKRAVEKDYQASIRDMQKAASYDSLNAEIYYNLGGAYYTLTDFAAAKNYWEKSLRLKPENNQAAAGLNALKQRFANQK